MWICKYKIFNDGRIDAEVFEDRTVNKKTETFRESKNFDEYSESFEDLDDALNCKTNALMEN